MIKLVIDGKSIEAPEGTTVLEAAKSAGIDIPHFCYHPRLSIAGNCRMCLVEIEGAKNPVISCKEQVAEGMVVRTNSDVIKKTRSDVLEFVLINHPMDCPICDQSGECKLQDYYFKYSLRPSRLRDKKVHKPKAQIIGPNVVLDSERCVECTRCVRFCEEIAGGHEIGLFERGDHSTIGVLETPPLCKGRSGGVDTDLPPPSPPLRPCSGQAYKGGGLGNPYSLCTVDLCPVGALTSKDFRFKKRVWFLKGTPSICTGCATGCNVFIDHADSIVYRYRPRENEAVNRSWMCDAGRMTYKELCPENRVLKPHVLRGGESVVVEWKEALDEIAKLAKDGTAKEIVGILSARSSVEENEAFAKMCRDLFCASKLFWSGAEGDPSFADKILRDADRNPNTKGVQKIAKERVANLKMGAGYVILDGLSNDDLLAVSESRPSWIVLVTSLPPVDGGHWADIILPKATHAEQEGTFINGRGIEQRTMKAFDPLPDSQTVEGIIKRITEKL